jgi:transcriptional regulator with XRE-family HTH domain
MEKHRCKELGDFLKARRAKILPSQVGLPEGTRRRIPGLRREEVAYLAGVGLTWYTWLEQGRDIRVSADVIQSLSRVLMLDEQERKHLYTLARQIPLENYPAYRGVISPMLQHVLDNLTLSPSFIMDARWNTIAWNKAAEVVFADFSKIEPSYRNMVWMMFNYPDYRNLFVDWEYHAQGMLARFRSACSSYVEDSWYIKFVKDMQNESKEFDLWWSQYNVQINSDVYKRLKHPSVGEMVFEFSSFDVSDNPSLKLIVNAPYGDTDKKVRRLLQ